MTPDDGPLPPPLPVRVRPVAGETAESYIRRLARANHLRPSLLQVYVRNPDVPTGAIRLRRLAAVSGSTRTALAFALTGLTPVEPHRSPPSPAESQAACKARLFGIIRDDAARGLSVRQITGRHHVHRRMVRQALAEPAGPPTRKRGTRPARAIDPIRDVLDKLAGEPLAIWEIWTTVTDERDSDASYAAVRDYIRTRRLAGQLGPSADQITTNDQIRRDDSEADVSLNLVRARRLPQRGPPAAAGTGSRGAPGIRLTSISRGTGGGTSRRRPGRPAQPRSWRVTW